MLFDVIVLEEVFLGVIVEVVSLVLEGRIIYVVNCVGYIFEGVVEEIM